MPLQYHVTNAIMEAGPGPRTNKGTMPILGRKWEVLHEAGSSREHLEDV
jgi:hypothetical protein